MIEFNGLAEGTPPLLARSTYNLLNKQNPNSVPSNSV
ncbi:hypothetical protein IEI_04763 [Bacillus wiedmannii]|nr:hypothetical protein IEI_04763 [Bacillus wiedmannii]SCN00633.1 Uncharacterized protein BCINRASA_00309 [Bacillus wiedmannii]